MITLAVVISSFYLLSCSAVSLEFPKELFFVYSFVVASLSAFQLESRESKRCRTNTAVNNKRGGA